MTGSLESDTIDTLIIETLTSLPRAVLDFYRAPPGRAPSDHTKIISNILHEISDESAILLITDIVDRTSFSVLYLMDSDFKSMNIKTTFNRLSDSITAGVDEVFLLDLYRERVNVGGLPHSEGD